MLKRINQKNDLVQLNLINELVGENIFCVEDVGMAYSLNLLTFIKKKGRSYSLTDLSSNPRLQPLQNFSPGGFLMLHREH